MQLAFGLLREGIKAGLTKSRTPGTVVVDDDWVAAITRMVTGVVAGVVMVFLVVVFAALRHAGTESGFGIFRVLFCVVRRRYDRCRNCCEKEKARAKGKEFRIDSSIKYRHQAAVTAAVRSAN